MWLSWSKPGIAYLDRGVIAVMKTDGGAAKVLTCADGGEFDALKAALSEEPARSWRLLLGPSKVDWAAVDRVPNIWRRHEREAATKAILSTQGGSMRLAPAGEIHVADPAYGSRWVAYALPTPVAESANALVDEHGIRVRSVESIAGAVATALDHSSGQPHLIAMICAHDVAWIVKSRAAVLECGVWKGAADEESALVDCDRLQLGYGIPLELRLVLRLGLAIPESDDLENRRGDWRWRDPMLSGLCRLVERPST